ncbi:ketoreductase [Niveomyces insectorum RCEF 264]|uniref:Ketoreductase n=1 Tax=Niveomyces insectorum RCEF 264 TaxID=1081102 RepID=A0A167Y1H1_9HYPO|nr:ketoreductase [Niveomyces insectorum RCEF 264]
MTESQLGSRGKVLLTGGTGFIASHILDALLEHGFTVVTTVRTADKGRTILNSIEESLRAFVSFVVVNDVAEEGAFDEAVQSEPPFDYVVHTASPYQLRVDDPVRDLLDPAIRGITGLLRSVQLHAPGVRRVVLTSSSAAMLNPNHHAAVYDESCWRPMTWAAALLPKNTYEASKVFSERAAWAFVNGQGGGGGSDSNRDALETATETASVDADAAARDDSRAHQRPLFDLTVINCTYTFGPVQRWLTNVAAVNASNQRIRDLVLGEWCRSGMPPTRPVFTWVDVRDVALAHVRALLVPEAGGRRFYVVGGHFSNGRLAAVVRAGLNANDARLCLPTATAAPDDLPQSVYQFDNRRARDVLGIVAYRSLATSPSGEYTEGLSLPATNTSFSTVRDRDSDVTEYPVFSDPEPVTSGEDFSGSVVNRRNEVSGLRSALHCQTKRPETELTPTGSRSATLGDPGSKTTGFPSPWHLSGPLDAMGALPIAATKQNAILIHTFGEVLYHLKGSFDGVPDDDNPFLAHYVPWCVQSPLLVQTSLYVSAQPLAERGFLDEATTMHIKGNAIHVLNAYLRTAACADDEAMAAVAQFIALEFYYGSAAVMQAHLQGLRQMVLLRGGFPTSRVGALVTKIALVGDGIIAMSLEAEPILQEPASFPYVYDEPAPDAFHLSFSSPLLPPRLPFGLCIDALGLHPATAWILDEVAFLINVVVNLPANPSEQETAKLQATAAQIHERISELPVDMPHADVPAAVTEPMAALSGDTRQKPGVRTSTPPADAQNRTQMASSTSHREPRDNDAVSTRAGDNATPRPHSLLPRYPKFSARSCSPSPSSTSLPPSPPPASRPPTHLPAGPLYTTVRLAAPLYTRAITTRTPLSAVCTDADALAVLAASWHVPLDRWRGVVGVFLFVMLAVVPTLHQRSDDNKSNSNGHQQSSSKTSGAAAAGGSGIRAHIHTRFAKSILQIGLMNVALVDWPVCRDIMRRALLLQQWLRRGGGPHGADGEIRHNEGGTSG